VSANLDQGTTALLARQPVLDEAGRVFGYELLYRVDASDGDTGPELDDLASARVLADAVIAVGLDALTGGHPAFIRLTRTLLVSDAWTLLPSTTMIVQLGPHIDADDLVVDACRRLREQGYGLCLDGFTERSDGDTLVPYATSIKVDVTIDAHAAASALRSAAAAGLTAIATHVDSLELAAEAHNAGYRIYQGSHFCAPRTFGATAMPARRLAYLNLLGALNRENLSVSELEEMVKHDAALTFRVLRLVNSAGSAVRGEVTSIRHALLLVGRDKIRKWATIWAMAGVNGSGTQEVVSVALLRARSCELIGNEMDVAENGAGHFLLGLCSLLDVMTGQAMEEALAEMPLDADIKAALQGVPNSARTVLDAVIAYEQGRWEEAEIGLERLGLTVAMQDIYADALKWARELSLSRPD